MDEQVPLQPAGFESLRPFGVRVNNSSDLPPAFSKTPASRDVYNIRCTKVPGDLG